MAVDINERAAEIDRRVTLEVARQVLESRLFEVVRERLGAAYYLTTSAELSFDPQPQTSWRISAPVDPGRVEEVLEAVEEVLLSLAETGPTADELVRAVAVTKQLFETDKDQLTVSDVVDAPFGQELTAERRRELADSVTTEQVAELFDAFVSSPNSATVIARPST